MRLTCPNCDAQYEVDDSLIPPEGRDVQCSNCTTTWFQAGAGIETPEPEAAEPEPPQEDSEAESDEELSVPSDTSEETATSDADDETNKADLAAASAIAGTAGVAAKPSSRLDADALNVIREEVDRETQAREAERGTLETQTDLGLDEAEAKSPASAARDRMARRRGVEDHSEVEDTAEPAETEASDELEANIKSELLPDIEEINSTLADAPDPVEDEGDGPQSDGSSVKSSRRGFRIGFGLALIIFAILIYLYAFGSGVSESVPALQEPLTQYRTAVDSGRVWLDGTAQMLVEQINGLIGQISGN